MQINDTLIRRWLAALVPVAGFALLLATNPAQAQQAASGMEIVTTGTAYIVTTRGANSDGLVQTGDVTPVQYGHHPYGPRPYYGPPQRYQYGGAFQHWREDRRYFRSDRYHRHYYRHKLPSPYAGVPWYRGQPHAHSDYSGMWRRHYYGGYPQHRGHAHAGIDSRLFHEFMRWRQHMQRQRMMRHYMMGGQYGVHRPHFGHYRGGMMSRHHYGHRRGGIDAGNGGGWCRGPRPSPRHVCQTDGRTNYWSDYR